jgi:MFS family permease
MLKLGPKSSIILLSLINLINFLDRGIIPGAPDTFQNFINETMDISSSSQGIYFGLLATGFIASFSAFSMLFGYQAISKKPFDMVASGMAVWIVAVFCCGLSYQVQSYYLLLFGRVLSGVGEASFHCIGAPFVDDYAPATAKALWMGIFLSTNFVGTALGYIYGSSLANSPIGWSGGFYLEGVIMLVLILIAKFCVPQELNQPFKEKDTPSEQPKISITKNDHGERENSLNRVSVFSDRYSLLQENQQQNDSDILPFWTEVKNMATNLPFVLIILGHAAYIFSIMALSIFGPLIAIGLGLFENEQQASATFGMLAFITGMSGAPIGGIIVDRLFSKNGTNLKSARALIAIIVIFVLSALGLAFGLIAFFLLPSKWGFLSVYGVSLMCLFAIATGQATVVMDLFQPSRRPFAIAANTIVIHVLGDVPSPIILGALKDTWAPNCGTVEIDGTPQLNPACLTDNDGLYSVILFPIVWFGWTVLFWGLACIVLKRSFKKSTTNITTPTIEQ